MRNDHDPSKLERWLYTLPLRIRSLFRRQQVEQELDEELRYHIDEKTTAYVAEGLSPDDAHRTAVRDMQGFEQRKEECRDARGVNFIEDAINDLRYTFRTLRRNLGFTTVAALTLALGIGANTAIYCIFYAALLAPFPYPDPDRLVVVWSSLTGNRNAVTTSDFLDWQREAKSYQILGAVRGNLFNLSIDERPEQINGDYLTVGFLDQLIGDKPFMGRYFLPEEGVPGKDHVVIFTHKLWRERFASDPNIIGKQVHINGELYTVIGIQPPGQPDRLGRQLVVPMVLTPEPRESDVHWLVVLGRLKPGVTIPQADAEMKTLAQRIADAYPKSNKNWSAMVHPLTREFMAPALQSALKLLMGAVGFVLLIACANVANLLLARGAGRQKEVAVRASIGASRGRLFRQFVIESLALSALGGALGIALAWALLRAVLALMPPYTLLSEADVRMNVPVLIFSAATTILAGLLFGCAPAWRAARLNLNDYLKESGRSTLGPGRPGLRRALIVAEFALALTLLTGGGLTIHSLWNLAHVDLGFPTDHLLTFLLPVPDARFKEPSQISEFYRQLLDRIQSVPGVIAVSASPGMPPQWLGLRLPFQIAGQPVIQDISARPSALFNSVTPGYFRAFEVRLLQGRLLTNEDSAGGLRVATVNESFAKKYFAGVDPLAQRILIPQLTPGVPKMGDPVAWQVVGVYHDIHNSGERFEIFPEIDVPFVQRPWPQAAIVVRSTVEPGTLTRSIGRIVQSMDSNLPMAFVRTMDQVLAESRVDYRFVTLLFGSFAGLALLLSALGIYGVMSFTVAQRTHEIGVRIALGAGQARVLKLILKEGMLLASIGLTLGFVGAYFVSRTMRGLLFNVATIDVSALTTVAAILLAAALLACYLPARRAANLDPMHSLRAE
jgi:putative ABC transport system permease protein